MTSRVLIRVQIKGSACGSGAKTLIHMCTNAALKRNGFSSGGQPLGVRKQCRPSIRQLGNHNRMVLPRRPLRSSRHNSGQESKSSHQGSVCVFHRSIRCWLGCLNQVVNILNKRTGTGEGATPTEQSHRRRVHDRDGGGGARDFDGAS